MQHTSGPWEVREVSDCAAIAEVGHMPHATVFNRATDYRLLTDEDKANACLISAAPELLAALKGLFEHCVMVHRHWGENSNQREADEAERQALAAIAKAEAQS